MASAHAPQDIFTKIARVSMAGTSVLAIPLFPIEVVTTGAGGCLIALTFGLFALVLTAIWLPFLGLLLGTSWLWLKAWPLRPILLIPGVLIATLSHVYVILAPEPERDAKWAKLALAEEWPLSWYLMRPPPEYYAVQEEEDAPTEAESRPISALDETSSQMLAQLRDLVAKGHSIEALREAGWSQWIDYFVAQGIALDTSTREAG